MMAQDPTNGSNVIVMAENLAVSVGGTSYDEKAYSDVVINTLPAEYGYEFSEPETVTVGDRQYYLLGEAVDGDAHDRRYENQGTWFYASPHTRPGLCPVHPLPGEGIAPIFRMKENVCYAFYPYPSYFRQARRFR